jgi:hypothetical protein
VFPASVKSQVSLSDSSINMHIVGIGYGYVIPGNDLATRFGNGNMLYISYAYKLKQQFIFEINAGNLFGSNVNENKIFDHIATSDGYLINSQGMLNPIAFEMKGFLIDANIKYLIPVWPNPNSGFYFGAGGGFLQHKISFGYDYGPLNQIEGDYLKGYDRLTNGITFSQNLGYYFFNNRNLGNFNLTFSSVQAFTQNRRDFNFDEQTRDDAKRLDLLFMIKLGINVPLYKKAPPKFY